jgi:hypothetical protein
MALVSARRAAPAIISGASARNSRVSSPSRASSLALTSKRCRGNATWNPGLSAGARRRTTWTQFSSFKTRATGGESSDGSSAGPRGKL